MPVELIPPEIVTSYRSALDYDGQSMCEENERPQFDAEYVRRLTEGDASVERHFVAYFTGLLNIKLRRRLRFRDAIDDVRQETFLRVLDRLRNKGGIDHPDRLGGFVNSVCNNVLLEKFRKDKRNLLFDDEAIDAPDTTIDMDRGLVDRDNQRLVGKVLREMPAKDVEILRMLYLCDLDKDEICRRTGRTRAYLRVLANRARMRFKAALGDMTDPPGAPS